MQSHQVPPIGVQHHFLLELHQARMSEIERDRNARRVVRTEPLARYPRVRAQPDAAFFEFFVETSRDNPRARCLRP